MTFPTANMRVEISAFGLITAGTHLNTLFSEWEWAYDFWGKPHEFASICHLDIWYRAIRTKNRFPLQRWRSILQQSAFFVVAAAIIIPIKKAAFLSGGCTHMFSWLDESKPV